MSEVQEKKLQLFKKMDWILYLQNVMKHPTYRSQDEMTEKEQMKWNVKGCCPLKLDFEKLLWNSFSRMYDCSKWL